ncbi:hypothetical protein BJX64DRAFT_29922 [Aspergillus heterothallicus]
MLAACLDFFFFPLLLLLLPRVLVVITESSFHLNEAHADAVSLPQPMWPWWGTLLRNRDYWDNQLHVSGTRVKYCYEREERPESLLPEFPLWPTKLPALPTAIA